MISLADREALLHARDIPLPADLEAALGEIVSHAEEADLLKLTHVIVVEASDACEQIADVLGFSPISEPIDGLHWRDRLFEPWWAYLGRRGSVYVLIHPVSDDGFAFILLIDGTADSDLVAMCRHFVEVTP